MKHNREFDNESPGAVIRGHPLSEIGTTDSHESPSIIDVRTEADEEISFSGKSKDYCVSIVDMVNSTRIVSEIENAEKVRRYYTIFLNTVATIARKYGAKTIKNLGDSLVYYFPMTEDITNKVAFEDVMECSMEVLGARTIMNAQMHREQLPSVSYRLSADYGRLELARCITSESDDFFGSTINICSKINCRASPNGMVIGEELYTVLRSLGFGDNFQMEVIGEYAGDSSRYSYQIYSVTPRLGSTFDFRRTCSGDSRSTEVTTSLSSYSQYGGQGKSIRNILLIDDEPDVLYTYKCFLASRGYNVVTFTNPREALIHFMHSEPAHYGLIILDIRMPHLNGLQLFYKFREINDRIKIIFVSALDAAAELVSILPDIKKENIMRKPVNQTTFLEKVEQLLS